MNKLPRIIYGQGENLGAGVLLLNEVGTPPVIGRIIQYESHLLMLSQLNSKSPIAFSTVQGYNIAIIYSGILGRGNVLQGNKDAISQVQRIMEEFAHWYLINKIEPHKPRFKRYLL